jgi:periplasmic divalent cation tolerance protein
MVAIVYTTTNNVQDARKIAHILVDEQLVACVNIIPNIESVYRWKGNIEEENEYVLLAKTVDKNIEKTIDKIKQFHSYELPDIVVLPIIGGLKDYLDYIDINTA